MSSSVVYPDLTLRLLCCREEEWELAERGADLEEEVEGTEDLRGVAVIFVSSSSSSGEPSSELESAECSSRSGK